jgi:hypothetical protein
MMSRENALMLHLLCGILAVLRLVLSPLRIRSAFSDSLRMTAVESVYRLDRFPGQDFPLVRSRG